LIFSDIAHYPGVRKSKRAFYAFSAVIFTNAFQMPRVLVGARSKRSSCPPPPGIAAAAHAFGVTTANSPTLRFAGWWPIHKRTTPLLVVPKQLLNYSL